MEQQPNIILIMCDQLRAASTSLYGDSVCPTPNLEALAQSGIRYNHAFTPHPLCVPARISLWSGCSPDQHGACDNLHLMPRGQWHAFRHWHEQGLHCALIGKNHCFEEPEDLACFDTWCEMDHTGIPDGAHHAGDPWQCDVHAVHRAHAIRRDMPRQGSCFRFAGSDFPIEHYGTSVLFQQAEHFVRQRQQEPFALWLSIPDPHSPIEAPNSLIANFEESQMPIQPVEPESQMPLRARLLRRIHGYTPDEQQLVQKQSAVYHAMVRLIDDQLGRFLSVLDETGLRENTIIVFCSDHGDFLGEHGIMDKGGCLYDCLTRVPLLVSWPGHLAAGQVDDSMVNLIDIVPTLLSLSGQIIPADIEGSPLPTITSTPARNYTFSQYGAGAPLLSLQDVNALSDPYHATLRPREAEGWRRMIRTREWKYVHDIMGDLDELYHLIDDPGELDNRINDPQCQPILRELKTLLHDHKGLTPQKE